MVIAAILNSFKDARQAAFSDSSDYVQNACLEIEKNTDENRQRSHTFISSIRSNEYPKNISQTDTTGNSY